MKKLLLTLLTISALSLAGCNETNQTANGQQSYKHVHLQMEDKCMHDDVVSYAFDWDGTMVEINTKTYGWVMVNGGYMLYNSDRCPLCNK